MVQTVASSSATASLWWRPLPMPSSPSHSPLSWKPVTWLRPSSSDTQVLKQAALHDVKRGQTVAGPIEQGTALDRAPPARQFEQAGGDVRVRFLQGRQTDHPQARSFNLG